jgi:integrase/recombinase XerD
MPRWAERRPIGDPNDPRSFEVLIARYLEWRDVHNYSQLARGTCESVMRSFGRWAEERGMTRPADVTRGAVERYQRWLFHYRREDGRPLAVSTQRGQLVYVRSFFRWLAKERYLLYDPTSGVELPREPPRLPVDSFSLAEVEQVLSSVDVATPLGVRDRSILEVLYSTGIRRIELVRLDLYDLDPERGCLTVRQGKGGKPRVVPIGERALAWLRRYLEDVRPAWVAHAEEWALFVNTEGERFNPDGLGNRVARRIRDSGVRERRGSCHLFRHTMATLMLEGGADVRFIQEILGHAKLDTTQIYTKVSIQKLRQVHGATHPGARLKRSGEAKSGEDGAEDAAETLRAALAAEAAEEAKEDDETGGDPQTSDTQ